MLKIRLPEYISNSSFKLFETDPEAFYRKYLTTNRQPREPQNTYMAIGSAFDAYVKADLHKKFVNDGDAKYTAEALFEAQVEPHNRDRAKVDGTELYRRYVQVGAYRDLCEDMRGCINPRFESDVTAELTVSRLEGGIPLLGKPDVNYIHRQGARVVHDFKCQGFYSKNPPAPHQGFVKMMSLGSDHMTMHKNCMPKNHKGILTNGNAAFNLHNEEWAVQLTFYAWALGEEVGSDYVLSVDQILSDSQKGTSRVAKHAGICRDTWQNALFDRLHKCWNAIKNGHVFVSLGYEESCRRCEAIEMELAAQPDELFNQMAGPKKRVR